MLGRQGVRQIEAESVNDLSSDVSCKSWKSSLGFNFVLYSNSMLPRRSNLQEKTDVDTQDHYSITDLQSLIVSQFFNPTVYAVTAPPVQVYCLENS